MREGTAGAGARLKLEGPASMVILAGELELSCFTIFFACVLKASRSRWSFSSSMEAERCSPSEMRAMSVNLDMARARRKGSGRTARALGPRARARGAESPTAL